VDPNYQMSLSTAAASPLLPIPPKTSKIYVIAQLWE